MREKVFHGTEQVGTEPSASLIGAGDGATGQDMHEEVMGELARGVGIA